MSDRGHIKLVSNTLHPSIGESSTETTCKSFTETCSNSKEGERGTTAWFIELCRSVGIISAKDLANLLDLPNEERAKALIYGRVRILGEQMEAAFNKRPDLLVTWIQQRCGCVLLFNPKALAAAEMFARQIADLSDGGK